MTSATGASAEEPPEETAVWRDLGMRLADLPTLRAAVDVLVPGLDACPPASATRAHVRVAASLEQLQRGSVTFLGRLLDMYARAERANARFVDLDAASRDRVLRALARDELDEIRDLVEGLHAFTLNAYLGGRGAERPAIWDAMGFHGPALGHLDLLPSAGVPAPAGEDVDA